MLRFFSIHYTVTGLKNIVRYTGVFIIKDFFLYVGSTVLGTINWTSFIMAADLFILLYVC